MGTQPNEWNDTNEWEHGEHRLMNGNTTQWMKWY